jgi:hypothetical protein
MSLPPNSLATDMWRWLFIYQSDELRRAYRGAREASDRVRAINRGMT